MFLSGHYSSFSFAVFFLSFLPLSLPFYIPDSSPLLSLGDQVRQRHLYTGNHRKSMFLEMRPDGRVSGTPVQTIHSVLELRSNKPGVTIIKGVSSSLYLCVDSGGNLRGQSQHTEADCSFNELLLANGYTQFHSLHHGLPVSLALKFSTGQHALPFTQFLPTRSNSVPLSVTENVLDHFSYNQWNVNLDSDDLLGMHRKASVSLQSPED